LVPLNTDTLDLDHIAREVDTPVEQISQATYPLDPQFDQSLFHSQDQSTTLPGVGFGQTQTQARDLVYSSAQECTAHNTGTGFQSGLWTPITPAFNFACNDNDNDNLDLDLESQPIPFIPLPPTITYHLAAPGQDLHASSNFDDTYEYLPHIEHNIQYGLGTGLGDQGQPQPQGCIVHDYLLPEDEVEPELAIQLPELESGQDIEMAGDLFLQYGGGMGIGSRTGTGNGTIGDIFKTE
jgi:hypothetical protein